MRTSIRRWAALPVVAALLGGSILLAPLPAAAQVRSKVAVVDVRRAVLETGDGLRVAAALKKLVDARQAELEAKQRKLREDKESLDARANSGKVSKAQAQKGYEDLMKRQGDIQAAATELQRDLERREQEMTAPIVAGIMETVRRLASQEGYDVVVEKSVAPHFVGNVELTERAIALYDVDHKGAPPGKGGKQAPKPAKAPAPKKK